MSRLSRSSAERVNSNGSRSEWTDSGLYLRDQGDGITELGGGAKAWDDPAAEA